MREREDYWAAYQRRRWLQPNHERFMRSDAARFMQPVFQRWPIPAYPERKWYDPNQPRDGRGRWTLEGGGGGGGGGSPFTLPTLGSAAAAIRRSFEAALASFAALSSRNNENRQAVVSFTARDYREGADPQSARMLSRDEVEALCPRLPEVEQRTDAAAAAVRQEGRTLSPSAYGTAVHWNLKNQIDGLDDPNFVAERSFLKEKIDVTYGEKGSIRVDVLENVGNGTVCVYDIKTGRSALTLLRSTEIVAHVYPRYPDTRRIIITEVRPRR